MAEEEIFSRSSKYPNNVFNVDRLSVPSMSLKSMQSFTTGKLLKFNYSGLQPVLTLRSVASEKGIEVNEKYRSKSFHCYPGPEDMEMLMAFEQRIFDLIKQGAGNCPAGPEGVCTCKAAANPFCCKQMAAWNPQSIVGDGGKISVKVDSEDGLSTGKIAAKTTCNSIEETKQAGKVVPVKEARSVTWMMGRQGTYFASIKPSYVMFSWKDDNPRIYINYVAREITFVNDNYVQPKYTSLMNTQDMLDDVGKNVSAGEEDDSSDETGQM